MNRWYWNNTFHNHTGGQHAGNGRGGISIFQSFADAFDDGTAGKGRNHGRGLQQEYADEAKKVEAGQENVDADGGARYQEEDSNDEGADDSAGAESQLLQGDGLHEVVLADNVEHEGPAAGVVEGPAGPSDGGGNEKVVGIDGPN